MSQVIKNGTRGEQVKQLQAKLAKLGFTVSADGIFGPGTQDAVEELQCLFGYDVDGDVGPATAQLIEQQVGYGFTVQSAEAVRKAVQATGHSTPLKQVLKRGAEGGPVRFLQRRLVALGYTLDVDGKYGDGTEKAVRALQQAFGYDVDGVVGEATHKLINQQIGYNWNSSKAGGAQPNA